METIFDYNPTEEELDVLIYSREDYEAEPRELNSSLFSMRNKEIYIREITEGDSYQEAQDYAMGQIVTLIGMREGVKKAKEYARKIKNPLRRATELNLLGGF